ncbi:MAG: replicative DNA helicase [Puniceicoccales bacterium]|jgi:replicative DNA helicase|nr:replicative DNA helicase [Puniceicoccales bacterium]
MANMRAKVARHKGEAGVAGDSKIFERPRPHSVEFEQALLACCVLEGGQDTVPLCIQSKISSGSFYVPAHQIIWQAISDLYDESAPINELILADKLDSRQQLEGIGGVSYVNRLCDRIDTPAHVVHYVKRVRDLELIRRVIEASMKNIARAYEDSESLDDFIEQAENEIFAISDDRLSNAAVHVNKPVDAAITTVQMMLQKRGEIIGVASGFTDLDNMLFGFRSSDMIVLAARPSLGKTSLAMNIAENVVLPEKKERQPIGTLFFSLEMSAEQLAMRLLCGRAGINMTKLREGFISKKASEALLQAATELKSAPLWIDESTNLTILEMRAKARRIHSKESIGLIIIDYLQLINGDSRVAREQQISEISRGIKAMAKELKIPVIVLSQLNRESEKERRLPRLSDLRESGAIEQDADVVMLLASQQQASGSEEQQEQQQFSDVVARELIIAKQRNGPIGSVPLTFIKNLTRFENYVDLSTCE